MTGLQIRIEACRTRSANSARLAAVVTGVVEDEYMRSAGLVGRYSAGQGSVGGEPRCGQVHRLPAVQDGEVRAGAGADSPRQRRSRVPPAVVRGRPGSVGESVQCKSVPQCRLRS